MTDGLGLLTGDSNNDTPGDPAPRNSRGFVRGVVLVVIVALLGALVVGFLKADEIKEFIKGAPEDYVGEGTGEVLVTIESGMNGLAIARVLEDEGVVASYQAFYELSIRDDRANSIQPGTFTLREKMSSLAALEALLDRSNRVEGRVTIPEGTRVDDIIATIAKNSDFGEDELTAALEDHEAIGLPDYAGGNPEGWLFPDTYFIEPGLTAEQLIARMVKQTVNVLEALDVEARAADLGMTVEQIVTIASILEWEVNNDEDFGKASRVIQNRLEVGEALRMDSTVHYISGRRGDIYTTAQERESDSPYNTYRYAGLPPGPIGSPGRAALEAAMNPAEGTWMYFVSDVETGETTFTDTYAEHQQACRDIGFDC